MRWSRIARNAAIFLAVLAVTGAALRAAGEMDVMEWAAVPAAVAIIGIFRALGPRAEHACWAAFLALLGAVYLDPNVAAPHTARELAALATTVTLAIGGLLVTPWLLVAGFVGHVVWDFLPRELVAPFRGLPLTCLLFDGLVAAYIAVQVRSGAWRATRERGSALTAERS